ncbi:MAG: hypothetical protein MO846_07670 [Candidatus Devosia symbiotica]|nr:hypothetical protein [Candidatus Devosia symbiotica]
MIVAIGYRVGEIVQKSNAQRLDHQDLKFIGLPADLRLVQHDCIVTKILELDGLKQRNDAAAISALLECAQ